MRLSQHVSFGALVVAASVPFLAFACGDSADSAPPTPGTGTPTAAPGAGGLYGTGGAFLDVDATTGGEHSECDGPNPPKGCLVALEPGCGDGAHNPEIGEECDDANSLPGDGCSGTCKVERPYFECPTAGQPCVSLIKCGDGDRGPGELCDDKNAAGGDGCAADCKSIELGYSCRTPGQACVRIEACGDGRPEGGEYCDDGNLTAGDGCSPICTWEAGFACVGTAPKYNCTRTVCGDKLKGNAESCDDGNRVGGDGCSPMCEVEPNCTGGACTTTCGDGLMLPGGTEQCDDGNAKSADGCSPTCRFETGFKCTQPTPGATMEVPVVYRDFKGRDVGGHPDFERSAPDAITPNMVMPTLTNGKPVYNPAAGANAQVTSAASFAQWFSDSSLSIPVYDQKLVLCNTGSGTYVNRYLPGCQQYQSGDGTLFEGNPAFFPVDGLGWVAQGSEALRGAKIPGFYNGTWPSAGSHNFHFTSEVRFWFEYTGNHTLTFVGDDDVWVFVNKRLAVDIGGIHSPMQGTVTLNASTAATYGLQVNKVYEIVVFQAERHVEASSYRLSLSGFAAEPTQCVSDCGDGQVAPGEECDLGKALNNGSYGGCNPDCTLGPRCGDRTRTDPEQCDDPSGNNTGEYGGCNPDCTFGPRCGDGLPNGGTEKCDDGVNDGGYGECAPGCQLGGFCGDGVKNGPEECDDRNALSHDGCSSACKIESEVR